MTTKIPVELSSTPSIVDNGDATAITIDSNENVGIGTTSPAVELHINDTGGLSRIRLEGSASAADNFEFGQGTTGVTNGGFEIRDVDAATTRFVIDSSGNIGLGTTSPANKLDVNGAIRLMGTGTDNDSHILYFNNSACTIARDANDLELHAYNAMVFGVSNTSYPSSTERMRIDSSGRLGLGTTSPTATYKLSIASAANHGAFIYDVGNGYAAIVTKPDSSNNIFPMYMLNNAGAAVGYILSTSSGTTFSQSGSDISFKENVKDWNENVLESFKNIKPSTFTYKSDENKKEIKGYIAQNEFDKFPEAYPINPNDGKHWFNPSGMTVYLMKAIQELSAKVEELEDKIE